MQATKEDGSGRIGRAMRGGGDIIREKISLLESSSSQRQQTCIRKHALGEPVLLGGRLVRFSLFEQRPDRIIIATTR